MKLPIVILVSLFVGIGLGAIIFKSSTIITTNNECSPDLKYVKPEQDCESFNKNSDKIQNMQDDVKRQVAGYLKTNRADRISVFVRDLDSQKFAYINETDEYFMASLLKVPLAVAYYRLAQLTPDLLDQKILYDGKANQYSLQEFKPEQQLVVGTEYTVKDLLNRALAYSDNTAAELLSENFVSYDYLQKILFTLGLQPKTKDQKENLVTARSYAGIFRTLYNSSLLSREYSNEILQSLSDSTFKDGASKDIPSDTLVAHKFAERSIGDGTTGQVTSRQLHDCGIVYAKGTSGAYSFCIMTEGKNFSDLESVIQNVSLTIYKGMTE